MTHWTRESLLSFLDIQRIHIQEALHPAVFTMTESAGLSLALPGCRCKNLLVRNKKGTLRYLIVTSPNAAVDLGALGKMLGSGRLFLCPAPEMMDLLGIAPGAMSPFSLIADRDAKQIQLVMDAELATASHFQFHPLINTSTVAISQEELAQFLAAVGHPPRYEAIPRRAAADAPS